MKLTNALIPLETVNALEIFAGDEAMDALLVRIRESALAEVNDAETDNGRKAIKSLAYKIARSKTTIDDAGKNLVADWKAKAKVVDDQRKKARETLDALKEEVLKPVTAWEQEQDRIAQEKADAARRAQEELEEKKRAEEAARLAEIERKEAEIREREEAIRRQEEEARAKIEAQERAKAEAEAAAKREEERKAEAERMRKEAEERAQREAQEAIERAQREAAEAQERAAREAEEAEKRRLAEVARIEEEAKAQIKAAEERLRWEAEENERRRLAEEQRKREEDEKRAANARHVKSVKTKAAAALVEFGIDTSVAEKVVNLIATGVIPAVKITF